MKYILMMVMSGCLFLSACADMPRTNSTSYHGKQQQQMLARVTAYWAKGKGSDRWTRKHKSAIGVPLHDGHCAVDAHKVPYGSRVVYPDGTFDTAVDTGSAVISRKAARKAGRTLYEKGAIVVDKFFETKTQAMQWATVHPMFIPVQIIPPVLATKIEDTEIKRW
jgi:3D (Asp-Asp-Asp) domain-containing protein